MALSSMYHRMEWKAKRTVMKEIIQCGGTIFGGAVRDWYIHDHYAEKYYKTIENMHHEDIGDYMDSSFLPEFKHRTVIPNDIDATIHISEWENVKKALCKQNFRLVTKFDRLAVEYIPNIYDRCKTMRHRRCEITVIPDYISTCGLRKCLPGVLLEEMKDLAIEFEEKIKQRFSQNIVFTLDLMIVTEPREKHTIQPPFGPLDFECNGLLANSNGLVLSNELHWQGGPMGYDRKYKQVTEDILNMKAVIARRIEGFDYRFKKMMSKGWTIDGFQTLSYIQDPAYDGYCIICHDETKEKHYKMKCCDARFHLKCAIKAYTFGENSVCAKNKCIMCKHFCVADMDATFLQNVQNCHLEQKGLPAIPVVGETHDSESDSDIGYDG